jgi:hypothetical protein
MPPIHENDQTTVESQNINTQENSRVSNQPDDSPGMNQDEAKNEENIPNQSEEERGRERDKRNSPEHEKGLKNITNEAVNNNEEDNPIANTSSDLGSLIKEWQAVELASVDSGADHEKLTALSTQFDYYNILREKTTKSKSETEKLENSKESLYFLDKRIQPLFAPLQTWVEGKFFQQDSTEKSRLSFLAAAKAKADEEYENHKKVISETVDKIRSEIAKNPIQETGTRTSQREESNEIAPGRETKAKDLTTKEDDAGTRLSIAGGVNTAASKVNGAISKIKGISVAGAATAGLIEGVSSLIEAYSAYKEMASSNNSTETQIEKGLEGTGNLANTVKAISSATFEIAKTLGDKSTAAGAQLVAGGASIAMGAIELVRGGYEAWNAKKRGDLLNELKAGLEGNATKEADQEKFAQISAKDKEELLKAIDQAAHVQGIKLVGAIAQAVKGAAMIIGGSLLLTAGPVGWMVLGGAAAISLIYAGYQWYKNKKKKTAVAEQQLGIVEERKAWMGRKEIRGEDKKEDPDPLGRELKTAGYGNDANISWWQLWKEDDITGFYNKYVEDTAKYLVGTVEKGEPKAQQIAIETLKGMGFNTDKGKTPHWKKVAKAFN